MASVESSQSRRHDAQRLIGPPNSFVQSPHTREGEASLKLTAGSIDPRYRLITNVPTLFGTLFAKPRHKRKSHPSAQYGNQIFSMVGATEQFRCLIVIVLSASPITIVCAVAADHHEVISAFVHVLDLCNPGCPIEKLVNPWRMQPKMNFHVACFEPCSVNIKARFLQYRSGFAQVSDSVPEVTNHPFIVRQPYP